MRFFYFLAALLALLAAGVQMAVVGPEIYDAVMLKELSVRERAVLATLWHGVSAVLLLSVPALLWAAIAGNPRARPLGLYCGALLVTLGGLYLSASWSWFGDALALPYWTLILPAGLFAVFAAL